MTATLLMDRTTLREQLESQIDKAEHILEPGVDGQVLLRGYESWDRRNRVLLENSFSKGSFLEATPLNDYLDFTGLVHGLIIPSQEERSSSFSDELRSDIGVKRGRLQDLVG